MATPITTPPRIALVLSTTRQPRACPRIATFVHDTIIALCPPDSAGTTTTTNTNADTTTTSQPLYTLHTLDLLSHPLPFHNEPLVPSTITSPTQYTHLHTRTWSSVISSFDAYIFVTPQYNWGYPAVLKNGIDYLFHEWKGKPAFVVSYGGHGGGKANEQLRQVLRGVRMDVVDAGVELGLGEVRGGVRAASEGRELGLDGTGIGIGLEGEEGVWGKKRGEILSGFEEVLRRCAASGSRGREKAIGV